MKPTGSEQTAATFWSGVGSAMAEAGRAVGAGALTVGRSVAAAYQAVDPDLRRQMLQAPLLGLMSLVPRPEPAEELDELAGAVVFIHGLAGHPGNFIALQKYFAHRGRQRTYSVDLRRCATLEDMAHRLREVIAEVGSPEARSVSLVAHSMGGIVSRLALEDAQIRARVSTLVTMGTPHAGTHLARLAATPRTLDLRPDSSIVRRLEDQQFWDAPDAPELIALWSRADTNILPAKSAAWDSATCREMTDYTHLSYLLSPAAWKCIYDMLPTR